jgi:predicted MFS family arabinose efflux permease
MFVNVPIGMAVIAVGALVLNETQRRHGRFDILGAVTSTVGMTSVVFGLVKAGTSGWGSPVTIASLVVGVALLASFIKTESAAEEPILPLRILANPTRAAANAARGLGYAGMYGMLFFLTQYLQDVQHHSALITGLAFLPTPTMVFLSSRFTGNVLVPRFPPKVLMVSGSALSAGGLGLLTRVSQSTSYPQLLVSLLLIGAGLGLSFVSLTTAALHGVDPADAGAASGVINVSQQLGAALGLAVLVSVFDSVKLGAGLSTHGLDVVFGVAAAFAVAALLVVALVVRTPAREPAVVPESEFELEAA